MKKLLIALALFTTHFSQAQWEPEVRLTNDYGISRTSFNNAWCVAASGDTVHVVWEDDRDGHFEVYYIRSTDGGISWGTDMRLTNSLNHSQKPSIAVSGSVVHVFWFYHQGIGNFEIYYKRSTDGGQTWGPDTQLTNANGNSWELSASTSGSTVHVVWEDSRDSLFLNTEIYYKRSTDGGLTWDAEVQLSNDPDYSGFPSIATSGSFVHVVWDDNRNVKGAIYYKRSTDEGLSWGEEIRLSDETGDSWMPCIAASDTGVHVVWNDWNNDLHGEIYYKQSTDKGITWGSDTCLIISPGDAISPSISASGAMVHIVWFDSRFEAEEIFYKHSDDCGVYWDPVDLCLTNSGGYSTYPSITAAGSVVHVVWTDYFDGNSEIYYKQNPTGNLIVGVENILALNSSQVVSIYPNPASSILNISFSSPSEEYITLRFMDMGGKTFRNYNFTAVEGMNQYKINLDEFRKGLYFIGLTTSTKSYFRKVIIQ